MPTSTTDQPNQVRLYKKRQVYQQYPQYLKNEAFKNQFLKLARIERTKMLLEGKACAGQSELELTLIDLEDFKFKVGDQFELFYRKTDTFAAIVIEEVLDEMIRVRFLNFNQSEGYGNQNNTQWIGCDTDKLQPNGTWSNQLRAKYTEHFEKVHEAKLRQSQTAGTQMRPASQGEGDQEMAEQGRAGGNVNYSNNHYGDNASEDDDDDDSHDNDDMYSWRLGSRQGESGK